MAKTLTTNPQVIGEASDSAFTAQLLGWYSNQSGNTATVHVKLRVKYFYNDYYYGTNKSYSLNFNGTSSAQYPSQMNNGVWYDMAERTESKTGGSTIAASGSWYSYTFGNFSVGLNDTVVLPQFVIAPTKPGLTVTTDNAHQNTIVWSEASFGNPSSGNVKLWYSTSSTFSTETLLDTKTTTGQWTYTHTGLTANTTYYYRAKADNGSETSQYTMASVTTRRAVYAPDENDETTLVQNLIVPFNGLSKNVIKLYRGDSNNEAERIY